MRISFAVPCLTVPGLLVLGLAAWLAVPAPSAAAQDRAGRGSVAPAEPQGERTGDRQGVKPAGKPGEKQAESKGARGGASKSKSVDATPLPDAARWKELLERDARVAFTARTGADARALLALDSATPERRAAAWIAIGSSGAVGERLELEDLARHGEGIERSAAILALGELATSTEALFTSLTAEGEGVADCALLALLRSGRGAARKRVEAIAQDPAHALHATAGALLVFHADRTASTATSAAHLLLELRWAAARHFGLVDGHVWHALAVQKLANDPAFLRELVLRGATKLYRPGVRDHLLQLLLAGAGEARITTAVAVMPLEVQELVLNDLWAPKDTAEWRLVLATIARKSLAAVTVPLLERAAEHPDLHYRATVLLAQSRAVELARHLDADFATFSVEDRMDACDAMAITGDASWRARLEDLEESLDAPVRLSALLARMRLGMRAAEERVRETLDDPEHADHAALVAAMLRIARDPLVGNLLEDYLPKAADDEALDIAIALCRHGRITARSRVSAALAADPPPRGDAALRLLQALGERPGPEDLELLRQLFPLEDRVDVAVQHAALLLELGDPVVLPLVRAALWRSEFDLSLLAGAVLIEIDGGVRALRDELSVPPPEASSADLRRVGFAVGAWGGLGEVEDLARELRYSSGHPALQGALLGALSTRTQ